MFIRLMCLVSIPGKMTTIPAAIIDFSDWLARFFSSGSLFSLEPADEYLLYRGTFTSFRVLLLFVVIEAHHPAVCYQVKNTLSPISVYIYFLPLCFYATFTPHL